VATSSGTCALHVALVSMGVGPGDLVVLPAYTFIASANAISAAGATPWLFDIDPLTWCLDVAQVSESLRTETVRVGGTVRHRATGRRIGALMPVYTLGFVPPLAPLRALADAYGIPMVADAAAAMGAPADGWATVADLSVLSFNGNKTVTSGGGGAIIGGDTELLGLVRHRTSTGRVDADYNHDLIAFNYRLTNVCAAVGCAQMEQLSEFVATKRRIRDGYRASLGDRPDLGWYPEAADRSNVAWLSGLVLTDGGPDVATVVSGLADHGVEARAFWRPMHMQAPYATAPRAALDVTERLWARVLTLPCSSSLTVAEQAQVVAALQAVLGG
jgi:dTDP-4-amino-4,6-dideoxygalactose transaminase